MIPRTFRASNIPAALQAMERELGFGALVVVVRHSKGDFWRRLWRRDGVEIVALPPQSDESGGDAEGAGSPEAIPLKTEDIKSAARLRKEGSDVPEIPPPPPSFKGEPPRAVRLVSGMNREIDQIQSRLLAQGISPELAESLIRGACADPGREERPLADSIRRQLQARLGFVADDSLCRERLICIIGRNGSGKTCLGVKIAVHAMKTYGRRARWITTDALCAGAIEKARALTVPMGIPMRLVYAPEELAAALKEDSGYDLTVIDTPGCNPYLSAEIAGLHKLLAVLPDPHLILVAPATAKEADLDQAATVSIPLGIRSLGITRMDETQTYGGICMFALRHGLPISCFSLGAHVLGDYRPANATVILDALLGTSAGG
jgi:flagellar biosynthesis protein FlhF